MSWKLRFTSIQRIFDDGEADLCPVTHHISDETDARAAFDAAVRRGATRITLTDPDGTVVATAADTEPLPVRAQVGTTAAFDGVAEFDEVVDADGKHWWVRCVGVRLFNDGRPTEALTVSVTDGPEGGLCANLAWGAFTVVADGAARRASCPHGHAVGTTTLADDAGIAACCAVPATVSGDGEPYCRCCHSDVTGGDEIDTIAVSVD